MNRLLIPLLLLLAPTAQAATCTMGASDLVFGNYRVNSATDVDSTATVSLNCVDDGSSTAVSYSIAISGGASTNPADRAMGGGALHYNVYTDVARTTVWGDGSGGSVEVADSIPAPGTGNATHTAHGTIPAGQAPAPGAYGDTLTITISY